MEGGKLSISNDPAISAIYFALLQCGYEFYSPERGAEHTDKLRGFIAPGSCECGFFSEVRQTACEVYPYWPRAFMLESATFYMDLPGACFADFDAYKSVVLSAPNISGAERDRTFWNWVSEFPAALRDVLQSGPFSRYLDWENAWTAGQNREHQADLQKIEDILELCAEAFNSPFRSVKIVLNPIKCVYSADYHIKGKTFVFCSGALRTESVIHEFIHHLVRPAVLRRKDEILQYGFEGLSLDASYSLDGGDRGKLNAFEEYMVRRLTDRISNGDSPENWGLFFDREIGNLSAHN